MNEGGPDLSRQKAYHDEQLERSRAARDARRSELWRQEVDEEPGQHSVKKVLDAVNVHIDAGVATKEKRDLIFSKLDVLASVSEDPEAIREARERAEQSYTDQLKSGVPVKQPVKQEASRLTGGSASRGPALSENDAKEWRRMAADPKTAGKSGGEVHKHIRTMARRVQEVGIKEYIDENRSLASKLRLFFKKILS